MDSGAILAVFMRWLHITSVVTLIGSFIYARFAVWPIVEGMGQAQGRAFIENMVMQFRVVLYTVLLTTLLSGLYNYLTKASFPPHYQMVIGIKFLFVLHIFAVAILYTSPNADPNKRRRWLTGMAISGIVVIALSADLRWLSLNALMH